MKIILLLSSILALLQPQFSLAQENSGPGEFEAGFPFPDLAVTQVWSGGFWQNGDVDGYIRFVVTGAGFEHVSNQLFIEWISIGGAPGLAALEARISVTELNGPAFMVFGAPTCNVPPRCDTFRVTTTNTYSLQSGFFDLRLTGIGTYQIKESQPVFTITE